MDLGFVVLGDDLRFDEDLGDDLDVDLGDVRFLFGDGVRDGLLRPFPLDDIL